MTNKTGGIDIGICIVLMFIFMHLMQLNIVLDRENVHELNNIPSHKEIQLPVISTTSRLVIESVISDYNKKRNMNKSNCAKIMSNIRTGAIRGAIGGAIMGGGLQGALSSAFVFGSLGGIMNAYNLAYSERSYLLNNKHT